MLKDKQAYLTKEEIKELEEVKEELLRAYKYSYKRNTTSKQNEIVKNIVNKYGYKFTCNHCPQSVFEMFKQLGKIYCATLEKEIAENQQKSIDSKKSTNKRGRQPNNKKNNTSNKKTNK